MFGRVSIIGVGLIGGSLARDLRRLQLCGELVGCGRGLENLRRGVELGVIDRFEQDPARAVAGADLVVLAVPLGAVGPVLASLYPALADGAIVTDVGSAKQSVIAAAKAALGRVPTNLVPGHPIAGTERSGVEAALDGLYQDRRVILTPTEETDPAALARIRAMWSAVGAEVIQMGAAHHDEVLAATSHLPHLLAYTLVDVLGGMEERVEIFRYAAGGFRDFSRIASSDPQMWHDICVANQAALSGVLDGFQQALTRLQRAVAAGEGDYLHQMFTRSKAIRDRYTAMTQSQVTAGAEGEAASDVPGGAPVSPQ
ncbi:MAG: prephenate dehydrogenase/arogenate dehydrogenase family protein [Gammaproteobacteria bacterium]|nr:prephenate dehydrogenase/arogenate dehydrogenase family protein [Gammaproteobacteria bacterium]